MPIPRVAVIAVHGVADQQPGDTLRSVVDLLVSSAPAGTCYDATATDELTLRVPPLQPQPHTQPHAARLTPPTPQGEDRPLMKSLLQSARSDFQTQRWAAPVPAAVAAATARAARHDISPADIAAPPTGEDRGIAVTNYLLAKHVRNGASPETYETTRISLERHDLGSAAATGGAGQVTANVDVYEMYWADLSRLSGSVPRIVSELFTLVFRLSKLGRETVDEMWGQLARSRDPRAPHARAFRRAWTTVAWLQIALDWLFVNVLALLFAQLALLGILLVLLGFTSGATPAVAVAVDLAAASPQGWLHRGVAGALLLLSLLRLAYRWGDGKWVQALAPAALAAGAAGALFVVPTALQWLTAFTFLTLLTAGNEIALRIADDRFPFVLLAGRWMWAGSMLLMLACAAHETQVLGTPVWRDVWIHAALFSTEAVLLMIKWWWILAGPLLVVWFAAGFVARREPGYATRASIGTGRLGITVSMGMFLAVTMTIWALVDNVLDASVEGAGYRPCIFAFEPAASAPKPAASAGPNVCMWTSKNAKIAAAGQALPSAHAVLDDRYVKSTSAFSLLATLLLVLVAYLLVMFTPSVAAELKLIADARRDAHQRALDKRSARHAKATLLQRTLHARNLGRWLTTGYRWLDLVVAVVSGLGVALSLGIALLFFTTVFEHAIVSTQLDRLGLGRLVTLLDGVENVVSSLSQALFDPLQALVFSAAGVGATLSVLGGQLSRRIPSLRGPLDVALDVDNHFREFPRTNIPRAHIFSRYAALLRHVQAQGYDRLVVVSHSQGTVISAELLRFLTSRAQLAPTPGDAPRLDDKPLPPVSLLTLGCPLRQLYGARFPGLYAWVLARNGGVFGPRAADVGVQRWINAFCSGDYVGRWLWSDAAHDPVLRHPMANTVGHDRFGRVDVYTGFNPTPPDEGSLQPAREVEVCLGLGAHTHYLERDQAMVAWMIDWLVRARPLAQADEPHDLARPVTLDATAGAPAQVVGVEASVLSDGQAAPAAAPDTTAPAAASPAPPAA